jgi:two-component system OmpR family sensor kinase
MALLGFFYYENEKKLYTDLTKSKLQNTVSKISSEIIFSHMRGFRFKKEQYLNNKNYKISFYDFKKKRLYGNLDEKMDFTKNVSFKNGDFILVDNSTVGHLGVEYIVIKDKSLGIKLMDLKFDIALIFFFIYSLVALLGVYLAKLFLRPIKEEREKLNNFIKDTTHELNTPISAILMSTESKTLNEKQVERINLSAKRISEIYKDLTYIFLEDDKREKSIELIRIDKLIEEQIEYFSILAQKKGIKIECELDEFEYKIQRDDFIRIINNLLSNAIKYNKMNGKIQVRLKKNSLEVKDSGIGIQKDKIDDIFKRYYRATNQKGGFGIGLNIVAKVCKTYRIEVKVSSQEKEGSTFTLNF